MCLQQHYRICPADSDEEKKSLIKLPPGQSLSLYPDPVLPVARLRSPDQEADRDQDRVPEAAAALDPAVDPTKFSAIFLFVSFYHLL